MTRDELIETAARALAGGDVWPQWFKDVYRRRALIAISAIEGAGWKIVGREPTEKMCGAGRGAFTCVGMFRAMFDAAPKFGDAP